MSGLRVLMYHKVSASENDFLTVTVEQITKQLVWLQERYNFITLRDLMQYIDNKKALPTKALLITFDDGYLNNYTLAYPIFKRLKIPFSIFLIGDFIGRTIEHDGQEQIFLNSNQLLEMRDFVQYGYHSNSHTNLMAINSELWETEVANCVKTFKNLPIEIEPAWAYTYGGFPKKNFKHFQYLKKIFADQGIHSAFRIGNRINKKELIDPYAIERLDIRGDDSFFKFKLKVKIGKLF